jgi:hypothetical protein
VLAFWAINIGSAMVASSRVWKEGGRKIQGYYTKF